MKAHPLYWLVLTVTLLVVTLNAGGCSSSGREDDRPNIIVLFADDLGYNDVSCYWTPEPGSGLVRIETPNIDTLAREGLLFTDFYAGSNTCTSSRASLLTGCYPTRVSMSHITEKLAVVPRKFDEGLHPDEETIADVLRDAGYVTACFGKWHIGAREEFWPTRQGFEHYYGIIPGAHRKDRLNHVIDGERVVGTMAAEDLTTAYTQRAVRFIKQYKDRPFFIYFAHHMPHYPLDVPPEHRGKSARGPYGDAVELLDWSTGEIMEALRDAGIDDNTLVVFLSDNGPDIEVDGRGNCYPLRGGKGWLYEGGYRVPCIARWPRRIAAGTSNSDIVTALDLLPTFAAIARASLPERPIDGVDVSSILYGEATGSPPRDEFYFYHRGVLRAIRKGKWKMHYLWNDPTTPAQLFDLSQDISEGHNVLWQHRDVAREMTELGESMRARLGDSYFGRRGSEQRPRGGINENGELIDVYPPDQPPIDITR